MQSNEEALAALATLSTRDRRLAGRTALVTHATDGIGEAIARVLAGAGARVAVHGKDMIRANAVSSAIMSAGGQAHPVPGDLSSPPAFVRAFVGQARANLGGQVDILVNHLDAPPRDPGRPHADLELDAFLGLMVRAPMVLVDELAPAMAARGAGAIVNVGPWLAGPARQWLAEHGARGVRVNTVLPGPAPVRPVDVAYAVRYLVSDEAALVQGVTLPVGGSAPPAWLGS